MTILNAAVDNILAIAHTDPTTKPPTVGIHWPKRWMDRHPQHRIRKQTILDIDRKDAHVP